MTRAIHGPPYTADDHALLAGLQDYERTLCPGGCGFPIDVAWHSDMDGWFDEVHEYVCHACTARQDGRERKFPVVATSRDLVANPLPPFDFGSTVSAPTPTPTTPSTRDETLEGGGL